MSVAEEGRKGGESLVQSGKCVPDSMVQSCLQLVLYMKSAFCSKKMDSTYDHFYQLIIN